MIGRMIQKIRKDKQITQSQLAIYTGMTIGHITHIEKEERSPSFKALKSMCAFFGVPYSLLMGIFDKTLSTKKLKYDIFKYLNYDKILAIDSNYSFIDCPGKFSTASLAIKITDTSMEPKLKLNDYAFVEVGAPVDDTDIGLFLYNNQIFIRNFIINKHSLILNANNKNFDDILISEEDNFKIIGKIVGTK